MAELPDDQVYRAPSAPHRVRAAAAPGLPVGRLVLIFLVIEFLDEFVYGAREAAWPLIREDLGLTYAQVGLLLGVPSVAGNLIEPFLGILGDVWKRRVLVLGGGAIFALSLLLTAASRDFGLLLVSFILFYPASGAFVSLSQATLMDLAPVRREQSMARWTFAGSLGIVLGPLALGAAIALGSGWRGVFAGFALLALAILAGAWRLPRIVPAWHGEGTSALSLRSLGDGLLDALRMLRHGRVWRWLILLECSDLLLDILLGFLALYMVDVAGATIAQAATAVAVWTGVGLLGDLLLIPLLERVPGPGYLRASAAIELVLFPAFLLTPDFRIKLGLLGLLGFFNAGWYAILQAGLFKEMPGKSGTALAVKNISGLAAGLIPLGLGLLAQRFGLQAALWLLILGPIALLVGLPRGERVSESGGQE